MSDPLKAAIELVRKPLSAGIEGSCVLLSKEDASILADAAELLMCPECGGCGLEYKYVSFPKCRNGCLVKRKALAL